MGRMGRAPAVGVLRAESGHAYRLWALNGTRDRRLALPGFSWARRLGHCGHLIEAADPEVLAAAVDCGVAYGAPASSRAKVRNRSAPCLAVNRPAQVAWPAAANRRAP